MVRAILIEGLVIGALIIMDGIYVVLYPPFGDEVQGYGIILIGIFILLATFHLDRMAEKREEDCRQP
jgi:hypothetical protein